MTAAEPQGLRPSVIEADDLALGFGDRLVLDGVTFKVPAGQLTCIIGGSGCGKSTLLRSFVGLAVPVRGNVTILGERVDRLSEDGRAALLARVGLMFQDGALLNSLTLSENLAIPLRAHTTLAEDLIADLVRMKLALVHLEGAGDKLPGELSGGMRKRAGLARALMLDPEVVFCDEPSAGLDPATAADIDRLFVQLRDSLGLTLVIVTHETASIHLIADRILQLEGGKIGFDGTLADALASRDPSLLAFFGRHAPDEERLVQDSALEALTDVRAAQEAVPSDDQEVP